jgi:glycosyltransferase involved in cell wall biosynthesis
MELAFVCCPNTCRWPADGTLSIDEAKMFQPSIEPDADKYVRPATDKAVKLLEWRDRGQDVSALGETPESDAAGPEQRAISSTSRLKIVAIIPAYNEERFIGSVVLQVYKYADMVIVVDDGSDDMTAEIAKAAGAIVLRHAKNAGKGMALNTGFRKARELGPEVVVTIDADGQHMPNDTIHLVAPILDKRADIVVGSRYLHPTSIVPIHRILGHRVFNFLTNHISGIALSDSQSGFRAFSQKAYSAFAFSSNGFSVESEMQFLAREHNLKMLEVPITISYRDKPKRPVIAHGMMVLNGVLHLIGQYRPLLYFGLPGLLFLLLGLGWGLWALEIYLNSGVLAVGHAFVSLVLTILGHFALFTALILHSIRGLLLDLVRPKGG